MLHWKGQLSISTSVTWICWLAWTGTMECFCITHDILALIPSTGYARRGGTTLNLQNPEGRGRKSRASRPSPAISKDQNEVGNEILSLLRHRHRLFFIIGFFILFYLLKNHIRGNTRKRSNFSNKEYICWDGIMGRWYPIVSQIHTEYHVKIKKNETIYWDRETQNVAHGYLLHLYDFSLTNTILNLTVLNITQLLGCN